MNLDLIATSLSIYGLTEVPGKADNPRIIEMAIEAGFQHDYLHDDVAWCSMDMNWVAMKAGYERSKALNARSWLNVGTPVNILDIQPGDVVVLWRDNPTGPFGHVGLYINEQDDKSVNLLAGNQGNRHCIETFPKSRIIGIRRLAKIAE